MRPAWIGVVTRFLLRDFRLKIIALMLSLILWFSMTYMGESKMGFLVPVSFGELAKGMMVRNTDTKELMVTVNGPLSMLKNLKSGEIRVSLNLSRAREGRHVLSIRKGDVIVPGGVRVEGTNPDYVVVDIDKTVEKYLRAVVELDHKWAGRYEVVSCRPAYVRVEGPREVLEKRVDLETLPVNGYFTRQQETLEAPLNIRSLEAVRVTPDTVRVVLRRVGG
jgi:hypothetical protein